MTKQEWFDKMLNEVFTEENTKVWVAAYVDTPIIQEKAEELVVREGEDHTVVAGYDEDGDFYIEVRRYVEHTTCLGITFNSEGCEFYIIGWGKYPLPARVPHLFALKELVKTLNLDDEI